LPSTSALITLPSADSDRLILVASCRAADKRWAGGLCGQGGMGSCMHATPSSAHACADVYQPSPKTERDVFACIGSL
jgi:hypothetical protein